MTCTLEKQGWHSGESTRLPPMWPGFDSQALHASWVEFVVGSCPCSDRFISMHSRLSVFFSPEKPIWKVSPVSADTLNTFI